MDKGGKQERWMRSETGRRLIDGQQEADAVADGDRLEIRTQPLYDTPASINCHTHTHQCI